MTIYIRMKEAHGAFRIGEDAGVDAATAKDFQAAGKAWITGGDPADFIAHAIEPDTDVGPSIPYAAPATQAVVIPAPKED